MYAIVRQGNGKYYTSAVFGYFYDIKSYDRYQRYLERIFSPYYIVLNDEKTRLVKVPAIQSGTHFNPPLILLFDEDTDGWNVDPKTGKGCISFLTRETADMICESHETPPDILEKCLILDRSFTYDLCTEVKSENDLKSLACISGGFHDACIKFCTMEDGGVLHVRFEGVWGCEIELWFWDDVSYSIECRNHENADPIWLFSSLFMENGYIYLFDDYDVTAADVSDYHCWFRAKHMRYRVIPD